MGGVAQRFDGIVTSTCKLTTVYRVNMLRQDRSPRTSVDTTVQCLQAVAHVGRADSDISFTTGRVPEDVVGVHGDRADLATEIPVVTSLLFGV
jgi:hypothetical protein